MIDCENEIERFVLQEKTFLGHKCDCRCRVRISDGGLGCMKANNLKKRDDNTKHAFTSLPNEYPITSLKILERVGLIEKLDKEEDGNVKDLKSSPDFSHPVRHIQPTNTTDDMNISPVEVCTFLSVNQCNT